MQRLTREQRLRVGAIAAITVIAAVVIAIVVTDLVTGGADEPKTENQVALGTGVPATTPLPRTPVPATPVTPTGAPSPTVAPTAVPSAVAEARDQIRKDDLDRMAAALEKYYDKKKTYPNTADNLQTLCAYEELDAFCKMKDYIDPFPADPSGDPGKNGYWYISDGKKYTIVAAMDLPANATPQDCPEITARHLGADKPNLYCVSGSR